MDYYFSTINQKSQKIMKLALGLILGLAAFFFILPLQAAVGLKILLLLLLVLSPLFIARPLYFLLFIFLVTPGLRDLAETSLTGRFMDWTFNFNFIIDASILIFGGLVLLSRWRQAIRAVKDRWPAAWFTLFLAFSASSAAYSLNPAASAVEFSRLFVIFILFLSSLLIIKNKQDFFLLAAAMLIGAILPGLAAFYQYFTDSGWWDQTIMAYRPQGTFSHPATLAFYLLFTAPVIYGLLGDRLGRTKKILLAILLLANLSIVLLTLTRGAWAGLLAMFLALGLFKDRRILAAAASIIFLIFLLSPAFSSRLNDAFNPKYNSSLTTRLNILQTTLPAFAAAPFFGHGFGVFDRINLSYNQDARTYESLQAHNDYLRLLVEVGAIGLIIYLAIFSSLFILLIKLYKTAEAADKNYIFSLMLFWVGILAVSLGDNILRTMPLQFLAWSYTGAVLKISFVIPAKAGIQNSQHR